MAIDKKDYSYVIVRSEYMESFAEGDEFESNFSSEPHELDAVVEEYAEYYHDNRDGWEDSWPVRFCIYDEEGKLLGRFDVEREAVPEFSATLVEEKKPKSEGK